MSGNAKTSMSLVFSVDTSNCSGFPWWAILLIVIGAVLVLAAIALIIILRSKSLRRKVFPFSKRNEAEANAEPDNSDYTANKSYKGQGKGKVNPVYKE